jgi:ribosomal protein L7/L12
MPENKQEMEAIRARIERLESQMTFLFRRMGITSQEMPSWDVSPKIIELMKAGDKTAAIRAFMDETGSSLKDAKNFIESLKI